MRRKANAVTAKEVAREAGVSPSTVSMILNNYPSASFTEETHQKVYAACMSLGYFNFSGSGGKNEKSLLLICPSTENMSYSAQVGVAQQRAMEAGYSCLVFSTNRKPYLERQAIQCLRTLPVAGAVFLYQPENPDLLEQAAMIKESVVVCDRNLDINIDTIESNSYKIGKLIANHLLELGHKHIAYIASSIGSKYITRIKRLEGIKSAFNEYGYDPDDCVKTCTFRSEGIREPSVISEYNAGIVLTERTLEKEYGVTAFIGYNDMIAYGIIDALKKRRFQIPQDYSVIGCDNLFLSNAQYISLTSVEHYAHLRARDAVDLLISKVSPEKQNDYEKELKSSVTRVEYEPKLVVRNSTGKPPRTSKTKGKS